MSPCSILGSFTAIAIACAPVFTVRAEALPLTRTPSLGAPRRPARIALVSGERLALSLAGGKRHVLAARHAREASIEEIVAGVDGAVALLRVTADDGQWVGLVGGRSGNTLLLFERADPTGDPGARRRLAVQRDGSNVRVSVQHEHASLCGDRPAPFEARALDPSSLTLVAATAPPSVAKTRPAPVSAIATREPAPLLRGLSAIASSYVDRTTGLPSAPRALLAEGGTGFAARAGAFAQMRWDGRSLPIERLSLEVSAHAASTLQVWWLSDGEETFTSELPLRPGRARYAIAPPAPIAGRCLALYVAQVGAEAPTLHDLRAYTALDRPGGVDALIGQLVQDGASGAEAATLLAELGPDAVRRLAARWDELSPRGQRRALPALARALDDDAVRSRVVAAAQREDPELRDAAITVLARGGDAGGRGLGALAALDHPAGDAAARALASRPEQTSWLLGALATEHGPDRARLRDAIAAAARHHPERVDADAQKWLATSPPVAARVALAQAAAQGGRTALAASIGEATVPYVERFDDRYRLALALAETTPGPDATAWLAREAEHAEEWMQRRAAFEALAHGGGGEVSRVARVLASDPTPRVRASALGPLVALGDPQPATELGAHDPWPLVRIAALRALTPRPAERAALERGLDDPAPSVRAAAIDALAEQGQPGVWSRVATRLAANEATPVRLAAISFARTLCVTDARDTLLQTARTLLSADASEEQTTVAVEALRALAALGGRPRDDAAALVGETETPALKALWARLPPPRCAKPNA